MRQADVTIVGGGLAGSLAAAMLGRRGCNVVLADPHEIYPPDFRCEKLDAAQLRILAQTGLTDAALANATPDGGLWVARCGHVIEKRPGTDFGVLYDTLVNGIRGAIPDRSALIVSKATAIVTSDDRQTVRLANGEEISSRLVVLTNGLNVGLRHKLGMNRELVSACHSISIGFDMAPIDQAAFRFPALTYFSEQPANRVAYITLFPIGSTMRANLFVYRDMQDAWLRQLREAPQQTLYAAMPRLRDVVGNFSVSSFMQIRPVDIHVTTGHRQPGVVLAGDAFATSCPATGLGARKVFVDVERLGNVHIPDWLASPGMGVEKINAYYDDPIKVANDAHSASEAFALRSFSIENGLRWRVERRAKFLARGAIGAVRRMLYDAPQLPPGAAELSVKPAPGVLGEARR